MSARGGRWAGGGGADLPELGGAGGNAGGGGIVPRGTLKGPVYVGTDANSNSIHKVPPLVSNVHGLHRAGSLIGNSATCRLDPGSISSTTTCRSLSRSNPAGPVGCAQTYALRLSLQSAS